MVSNSVLSTEGNIAIWDTYGNGKPVVFLHGNSASKEFFHLQFDSELAKKYRFIAIDLPGHGESDPAAHPEDVYSIEGYASVIQEVITQLQLENPTVVGWSLGGHIGINLLQRAQKLAGLLITGTPPIKIGLEGFMQGFQFDPELAYLFDKEEFSEEEAKKFVQAGGFDVRNPLFVQAALKTDGRARKYLMNSNLQGIGGDQRELVETNITPLCVVQGEKDKNINNSYIKQINYKNLFEGKVHEIEDANHAAFYTHAEKFNAILGKFLSHVYREGS